MLPAPFPPCGSEPRVPVAQMNGRRPADAGYRIRLIPAGSLFPTRVRFGGDRFFRDSALYAERIAVPRSARSGTNAAVV